MTRDELLQELSAKITAGEITREELSSWLQLSPVNSTSQVSKKSNFSINKILYVIGAIIVIIGLAFFVSQIWEDIGSVGHIAVTLGMGALLTGIGSMLLIQKPEDHIGSVFHLIGGVLVPGGALVLLNEFHVDLDNLWPVAMTFAVVSLVYLALSLFHKNAIVTFFAIANATVCVYVALTAILQDMQYYYSFDEIYAYLTMIVGISYLLLSRAFRGGPIGKLSDTLTFFGTSGFFGAAFSRVFDSGIWQLLFFVLVALGLFLAVRWKDRTILAVSTLALIGHITYITTEYFADSVGWPILLVLLGFLFIGLGYGSVALSKKYISKTA